MDSEPASVDHYRSRVSISESELTAPISDVVKHHEQQRSFRPFGRDEKRSLEAWWRVAISSWAALSFWPFGNLLSELTDGELSAMIDRLGEEALK